MADEQASGGGDGSARDPAGTGATRIAPQVVRKVVALAANDVSGIHATGGSSSRTAGAVRERAPGRATSLTSGVRVEVGSTVAVDLDVVIEYGAPLVPVTRALRDSVVAAVEGAVGLHVVQVDIAVNDVHLPAQSDSDRPAENTRES